VSIYSTHFWQGEGTGSAQTLYTVASTQVAIIRDVEYLNNTAAQDTLYLTANVPGFSPALFAIANQVLAGGGAQWQGRVVLPSSSSISLPPFPAGVYVIVCGYLFDA